jgi:signal peptidase I
MEAFGAENPNTNDFDEVIMMDEGHKEENKAFDIDFIADYTINYSDSEPETEGKPAARRKQSAAKETNMGLYEWLQCVVSAVVACILFFVFIAKVDGIKGPSMMQTLQNGDTVILSSLFYTPKFQDIVFIKTDAYETPIVKRVIATEGQTVDIDFEKGIVSVDGRELQENYVNTPTTLQIDFHEAVTVPEGHVFVMGDNRNESSDSRDNRVGMIDVKDILGKVFFILIPGEGYAAHRDWSRIGFVH